MDIIGALTLDVRLNSQRERNPLATALRSQLHWHILHDEPNLFVRWNPVRPFVQWNGYHMDKYIWNELDKRYAEWTEDERASSRSIIHLALAGYMAQQGFPERKSRPAKLDESFKSRAAAQIRLFMFAGHDSTASTICYCFHNLHSHPDALAAIRLEHDTVFGTDLRQTTRKMRERGYQMQKGGAHPADGYPCRISLADRK